MIENLFEAVIDWDTFLTRDGFDQDWKGGYPWGSDHNGSARMAKDCVVVEGGVLSLTAKWLGWEEGKSSHEPYLPIRYHSGAIHAPSVICINSTCPAWEIRGEFQAPDAPGSWPAFWLTGSKSWPPEMDILEFKGSNVNWHNTFHQPRRSETTKIAVKNPNEWHQYRMWLVLGEDGVVWVHYFIDGCWTGKHHAPQSVIDCPLHIIINLQMEGASGKNGPRGLTVFRARNIYVGRRLKVSGVQVASV
jgi:hypothetical protein